MSQDRVWMGAFSLQEMPDGAIWQLRKGFEFRAYLNCWVVDEGSSLIGHGIELGHEWRGDITTKARIKLESITHYEGSDCDSITKIIANDESTYFIINHYSEKEEPYPEMRIECVLAPMFYSHHLSAPPSRSIPSFAHLEYTWRIRKVFKFLEDGRSVRENPSPVEVRQCDFFTGHRKSYFLECEIVGE